ncbi:hypothetical protein SNOG_13036 [Parastagonospora nodorum SN15]|uniref:Major facilitator superfamily (MFS) profile domain-containing protein n=1 Tax=Phaeosphaeria nodorum (strain SN15 / ATCC MYA-4574 / FGSC 10173) TaxID=321614 RepID=Q0U5C8_PHANO|nr:hypothetical protein SNOG_13036 [Parastagonospora nodorum SN15]EAT79363.1 hypothetical protein SNOG_13036 [Parastagonospora nodorum SN15]
MAVAISDRRTPSVRKQRFRRIVDWIGRNLLIVLLIAGSVGVLVAIFMISLCSQYYQVFLAHGVLLGISMGFVTWPPMAVVSRNLPHHRGLALGVVTGGSSVGGIVWSIMIEQLLNKRNFGFPWTVRVVGFTMLPLLVFACSTITEPPKQLETQPRPGLEPTAESSPASPSLKPKDASRLLIRSPVFISLCVGFGLAFLGLFSPFFYIPSYAASHGASAQTSFYMISIMNAATLFGRVIPGAVADRVGHYNVMVFLLLFSGIISFCWTAVHTLAGLVIWSIAYGFSSGVGLPTATLSAPTSRRFISANRHKFEGCSKFAARLRRENCDSTGSR